MVLHDVFDHVLNAQIQTCVLSDSVVASENGLEGTVSYFVPFESKCTLGCKPILGYRLGNIGLNLEELISSKAISYSIISLEEVDLNSPDYLNKVDTFFLEAIKELKPESLFQEFLLQAIGLLPDNERRKLLSCLYTAKLERKKSGLNKSDFYSELGSKLNDPEYKPILDHLAKAVVRGQVLRGLISMAYYPYNKELLGYIQCGLDLSSPILQEKQEKCMQEIGYLNELFKTNPEIFDSYGDCTSYQLSAFETAKEDNTFEEILRIRNYMYGKIKKIMDDPLMEKLAREMWAEYEELKGKAQTSK